MLQNIYFSPTLIFSFPTTEFVLYPDHRIYFFLKLLHSVGIVELGTGAYIQGSFLSTCLCIVCCVWRFILKTTISPRGMAWWLYCFVHVYVGHIASHDKPTVDGWTWDNYLTKPAWKHCLVYYVILPHNAIMCVMIIFYKEKPANSCLSIEGCTRNCLCCEMVRTDHL